MDKNTQNAKTLGAGIAISSRIRLARNVAGEKFVNSADKGSLSRVFEICAGALSKTRKLKNGKLYKIADLPQNERLILLETRRISSDLLDTAVTERGLFLALDGSCGAMINEEDHLRIFGISKGLNFSSLWKSINALDDNIEEHIEYAFSNKYGYLTACPTNVGTGMRASLMMHLPALVFSDEMEKVIRGINQLGMTFRGAYGEGSESNGAIFQLSNQQTLGMQEEEIIKKISKFGKKIREFELDAREKLCQEDAPFLADKFLRAQKILECCRMIDTEEAMTHLSALRLAADMGRIAREDAVEFIDALILAVQPAHLTKIFSIEDDADKRDIVRANYLRKAMQNLPAPIVSDLIDE